MANWTKVIHVGSMIMTIYIPSQFRFGHVFGNGRADFRPFPSKVFAMLYILLHEPRPMVICILHHKSFLIAAAPDYAHLQLQIQGV